VALACLFRASLVLPFMPTLQPPPPALVAPSLPSGAQGADASQTDLSEGTSKDHPPNHGLLLQHQLRAGMSSCMAWKSNQTSSAASPGPRASHRSLPGAVKKAGKPSSVEGHCQRGSSHQRPPKGEILETNLQRDVTTARAQAL